jgi:hypothetical protein
MEARVIYSEDEQSWFEVTSARLIIEDSEQSSENS